LFGWRGQGDVEDFVSSVLFVNKTERIHPTRLLQLLGAWQDLSQDFIGLLKSEGFSCIMVVVDRYFKYVHFFSLKHPYTAAQVAQVFLYNIVKLHGVSKTLVSDRDKKFTSHF
jgi:hypothetical protein